MPAELNEKYVIGAVKNALNKLGQEIIRTNPKSQFDCAKSVFGSKLTKGNEYANIPTTDYCLDIKEMRASGTVTIHVLKVIIGAEVGRIICEIGNTPFASEAREACENLSKDLDWPLEYSSLNNQVIQNQTPLAPNCASNPEELMYNDMSLELKETKRKLQNAYQELERIRCENQELKNQLKETESFKKEIDNVLSGLQTPIK